MNRNQNQKSRSIIALMSSAAQATRPRATPTALDTPEVARVSINTAGKSPGKFWSSIFSF